MKHLIILILTFSLLGVNAFSQPAKNDQAATVPIYLHDTIYRIEKSDTAKIQVPFYKHDGGAQRIAECFLVTKGIVEIYKGNARWISGKQTLYTRKWKLFKGKIIQQNNQR
ncbi:MAG: hypothetical protein JST87_05220 [Bacteroidetes bacterium]|nr:hypothetical protein [Bacteroidota bacterium]